VEGILAAVVAPFVTVAAHPAAELRSTAVRVLAARPEPAARSALARALRDPDEAVRASALAAAPATQDGKLLGIVTEQLLAEATWTGRLRAAEALGRIGRQSADAGALEGLARVARSDPFALVREAAVRALAQVDPAGSGALLAEVARADQEPRVRRTAKALLETRP
jgi:HEAT repeat protein